MEGVPGDERRVPRPHVVAQVRDERRVHWYHRNRPHARGVLAHREDVPGRDGYRVRPPPPEGSADFELRDSVAVGQDDRLALARERLEELRSDLGDLVPRVPVPDMGDRAQEDTLN